jgi:hypothetical protein
MKKKKKKKKKIVSYELVQAIQASIQNKVAGMRGTRVVGEQPAVTSPVTAPASKKEAVPSDSNNNRRFPLRRSRKGRNQSTRSVILYSNNHAHVGDTNPILYLFENCLILS